VIEYPKKDCSLVESFSLPRAKYIGNADTILRQKPAAQAQHETKTRLWELRGVTLQLEQETGTRVV
jgi:hypothetical protein